MKKLIFGLFIILFVSSVILNFIYYFQIKNNKNGSNCQTALVNTNGLVGKVISVNDNELIINDGQKDSTVRLNSDTQYFKNYTDPIEPRNVSGNLSDVLVGLQVGVTYLPNIKNNDLIAQKVDILIDNYITGIIKSINNNEIIVFSENNNKEYQIVIDKDTKFYTLNINISSVNNGQLPVPPKPVEVSLGDIQIDQKIDIYLIESIEINPMVADQVLQALK